MLKKYRFGINKAVDIGEYEKVKAKIKKGYTYNEINSILSFNQRGAGAKAKYRVHINVYEVQAKSLDNFMFWLEDWKLYVDTVCYNKGTFTAYESIVKHVKLGRGIHALEEYTDGVLTGVTLIRLEQKDDVAGRMSSCINPLGWIDKQRVGGVELLQRMTFTLNQAKMK